MFYSYPNGKCHVKQHRQHGNGTHSWEQHTYNDCVFDMMSIFLRARSFNPTGWRKGHDVNFPMADGNGRYPARLRYEGKVNVKTDDGHTYRCIKLAYLENEKERDSRNCGLLRHRRQEPCARKARHAPPLRIGQGVPHRNERNQEPHHIKGEIRRIKAAL